MTRSPLWLQASFLAALISACDAEGKPGDGDDTDTGDGGGAVVVVEDLAFRQSPVVPTVTIVTWRTDVPTYGSVTFREDGGELMQTAMETEASLEHEAVLVGLPESADAVLNVVSKTDDGLDTTDPVAFSTGVLAANIPRPALAFEPLPAGSAGFTIVPMATMDGRWATIVDSRGRMVWAWGGVDLDTQRVRLTQDGKGVILMDRERDTPGMELVRVDWDGTERWRLPIEDGHHDFDLVDDDTFIALAADVRDVEQPDGPVSLVGDKLVEVELDGNSRTLWSAWDHFEAIPGEVANESIDYPGSWDWSHGNFVHYDREADAVQLTLRELDAAVEVDRATGETAWIMADVGGDFRNTGTEPLLRFPHSVVPLDGGLLVFNQGDGEAGECASASIISVDEAQGTAQRSWNYTSDACFFVNYLGNAEPLADGRVLVSFGIAGAIDEVDGATGETIWRLQVEAPAWILYVQRFDGFGPTPAP